MMKENIKLQQSFTNVKRDMSYLYGHIENLLNRVMELEDTNARLISAMTVMGEVVAANQERHLKITNNSIKNIAMKKVSKKRTEKKPSKFVASKIRNKVHKSSCSFAKNIKRSNKKVFTSKSMAKKAGFKDCKCMK